MLGENWTRNTASFFLEKKVFEMKGYETKASAEVNGDIYCEVRQNYKYETLLRNYIFMPNEIF